MARYSRNILPLTNILTKSFSEKTGSFINAFNKFETILSTPPAKEKEPAISFGGLLRNSKFIQLGDPVGKILIGHIFHVVGDDLYIDFGCKFHCVCKRPRRDPNYYIKGIKVKVKINDLEVSSRFLGSDKDITLLEADATLLGLMDPPKRLLNQTKPSEKTTQENNIQSDLPCLS